MDEHLQQLSTETYLRWKHDCEKRGALKNGFHCARPFLSGLSERDAGRLGLRDSLDDVGSLRDTSLFTASL